MPPQAWTLPLNTTTQPPVCMQVQGTWVPSVPSEDCLCVPRRHDSTATHTQRTLRHTHTHTPHSHPTLTQTPHTHTPHSTHTSHSHTLRLLHSCTPTSPSCLRVV